MDSWHSSVVALYAPCLLTLFSFAELSMICYSRRVHSIAKLPRLHHSQTPLFLTSVRTLSRLVNSALLISSLARILSPSSPHHPHTTPSPLLFAHTPLPSSTPRTQPQKNENVPSHTFTSFTTNIARATDSHLYSLSSPLQLRFTRGTAGHVSRVSKQGQVLHSRSPRRPLKAEITALDGLRKSNIISGWRESEGIKSEEE